MQPWTPAWVLLAPSLRDSQRNTHGAPPVVGKESFSNLFGDNLTSDGRTAADAVGMPLSVEANSDGGPLAALAATEIKEAKFPWMAGAPC